MKQLRYHPIDGSDAYRYSLPMMSKMPPDWFAKNEYLNTSLFPQRGMTLIDPWGERTTILAVETLNGENGVITALSRDGHEKHYSMSGWQRNFRLKHSNN